MPASEEAIFWGTRSADAVRRWDLRITTPEGMEWIVLDTGGTCNLRALIGAEVSIIMQSDYRYRVQTARVNTQGPNFRRGARDLTFDQADQLAASYRALHNRYVWQRFDLRPVVSSDPVCDYCNQPENNWQEWDGEEGMHVECVNNSAYDVDFAHRWGASRVSVSMPTRPDRPRMNLTVPGSHPDWHV